MKAAQTLAEKLDAALDSAAMLTGKPTYYLLHEVCTKQFMDLVEALKTMKVLPAFRRCNDQRQVSDMGSRGLKSKMSFAFVACCV